MIVDEGVFREDHLPHRLLHRESEVDTLLRAWEPAIYGDRPEDILMHGPSGVGKTVLSKHCARKLRRESPVEVVRVRCINETVPGILRQLLGELTGTKPAMNTPQAQLEADLTDVISEPTIAILDEADDLPRTDLLKLLPEMGPVGLVAIAHDQTEWLARIDDDQVRSRFDGPGLAMERYGVAALADILDERVRMGLSRGVVTRAHLEYIADEVAGVARYGIQTLRESVLEAERCGADAIERVHIDEGFELAKFRIRQANIRSSGFHHRVLYELVRQSGRVSSRELHDQYERVAEDVYANTPATPIGSRYRRDVLSKLVAYDLLRAHNETKYREYEVCDPEVRANIELPRSEQHAR